MPKSQSTDIPSHQQPISLILIFPNQLFHLTHPKHIYNQIKSTNNTITCLIEDRLFFGHPKYTTHFHTQKLLLHRASMQHYFEELKKTNSNCMYIQHNPNESLSQSISSALSISLMQQKSQSNNATKKQQQKPKSTAQLKKNIQIDMIHIYDPVDFLLKKNIQSCCKHFGAQLKIHDNPGFLLKNSEITTQLANTKRFFFTQFYINQRKKFSILLKKDGAASGGKWSFDVQNRKKIPKNHTVPPIEPLQRTNRSKHTIHKATQHIQNHYTPPAPLSKLQPFIYPITHQEADQWFNDFLHNRLRNFGTYEDAIQPDHHFLYHSVLTPSLNIGLLTPDTVIQKTLTYAKQNQGTHKEIPLNSLEGFVRQIIGWREYMRALYELIGVEQRNANTFHHKRTFKESWYTGKTGLKPLDDVIHKLQTTAYAHHIERLMIAGNCMLLCEIDPNQVYTWFMEFFIDSYDWVMVPNVYGMSQYSDAGKIVTKPYISSSNYIRKMSDYKQELWCEIWDGLYWRFIAKNAKRIKNNPRIGIMTAQLQKMDPAKKKKLFSRAEAFLEEHTLLP